jgi:hypothetical protein
MERYTLIFLMVTSCGPIGQYNLKTPPVAVTAFDAKLLG